MELSGFLRCPVAVCVVKGTTLILDRSSGATWLSLG